MLQIRNAPLIRLLFSHLGDVHADNPLRLEPVSSADAVPAISRENVEAIGSGHGTTIFGLGRLLEVITHRWFYSYKGSSGRNSSFRRLLYSSSVAYWV